MDGWGIEDEWRIDGGMDGWGMEDGWMDGIPSCLLLCFLSSSSSFIYFNPLLSFFFIFPSAFHLIFCFSWTSSFFSSLTSLPQRIRASSVTFDLPLVSSLPPPSWTADSPDVLFSDEDSIFSADSPPFRLFFSRSVGKSSVFIQTPRWRELTINAASAGCWASKISLNKCKCHSYLTTHCCWFHWFITLSFN